MATTGVIIVTALLTANVALPFASQIELPLKRIDFMVGTQVFCGDPIGLENRQIHLIITRRGPERSRVSLVLENIWVAAVDAKTNQITLLLTERDHLRLALARQIGAISLKPWPLQPPAPQPPPQFVPPRLPRNIG